MGDIDEGDLNVSSHRCSMVKRYNIVATMFSPDKNTFNRAAPYGTAPHEGGIGMGMGMEVQGVFGRMPEEN